MSDDEDQAGSKTPVWKNNPPEPAKEGKGASAPALEFNIDTTKSFFDSNAATKEKESPKKSSAISSTAPKPTLGGLKIRPLANMLEVKKEVVEPVQVKFVSIFPLIFH